MTGIAALHASAGLLLGVGMDTIESKVLAVSRYLMERLQALADVELLSPTDDGRRAGIVLFRRKDVDTEALYRHLQRSGVICAMRGDGVRFSPHFYTPGERVDAAVSLVAGFR